MSTTGLHHDPNHIFAACSGATPNWYTPSGATAIGQTGCGENVGDTNGVNASDPTSVANAVNALNAAFIQSRDHYDNIIGNYDKLGVGVYIDGTGTLWVTFEFSNG